MQHGRHICSGTDAINVKFMYTSALVTLLIAVSSYDAYILIYVISAQERDCMVAFEVSKDRDSRK